ncbi:serine-rich adhesin for platelets [Condylostylus longicornis]|uniref:serine-rich adhesin for platelets n=1 Tax=Condylostylus longicornis TaxID=2530218 RepID=UPI00244E203B|nr:serine-rich adhesin for platelets [Condylostylus longicornis]
MMVDKAVSTNDNNFNEFSRAYKYDAVISTLIENKILSIKKECKENSSSKRKRRKSLRKISFSRKFFVSCRSKRSSLGSGISNINDGNTINGRSIVTSHNLDDDIVDKHQKKTDLNVFDDGTVNGTPVSPTISKIDVIDLTSKNIDYDHRNDTVLVGKAFLKSRSSSHDETDYNTLSQNEQSTSKILLLKDASTSSSAAFQCQENNQQSHPQIRQQQGRHNQLSLSSSTSSSVSTHGRYDGNILIRVIDKKKLKHGIGDDGSGSDIGDISSNESIDISGAIVSSTSSKNFKEKDKNKYYLNATKKRLISEGLVASIKHSFHSLALYNQYNNKSLTDVENNFLYEAKSISAPTSPTILFSQNTSKPQTTIISSENVKSQVSYIRNSIRCPNSYNNNNIAQTNTNINPKINRKILKSSLSEIFSRQNTSEDSANITISTVLNESEIGNTIETIGTAATSNINNIIKDKPFHRIDNVTANTVPINNMDFNSIVTDSNEEPKSSNQNVENRLDSVIPVTVNDAKFQKFNINNSLMQQNENRKQSNLNSETVIIDKKSSNEKMPVKGIPKVSGIAATSLSDTYVDNVRLENDKFMASSIGKTTTAAIIEKFKKSDELFQNLLENQNVSNVSSILPSSMTGSNFLSINGSYTSQTIKTQSTTTGIKLFDRNAFLPSRMMNGRYLHTGSDDEYRRNKRKYKRYHRCSDPVLVYPSTSGLQHCILSMPPNQIHQINCNEDLVYDLTYQADQNANDDKASIMPEPIKKSRHHKHKKKHRHRQKPKILVHDLDTQSVKVIDPDDLPQRARWTIIATACLLLLMCLMLVGITLRMAPIIDDIVRQENERLMQESLNRARLAKNYTESDF